MVASDSNYSLYVLLEAVDFDAEPFDVNFLDGSESDTTQKAAPAVVLGILAHVFGFESHIVDFYT